MVIPTVNPRPYSRSSKYPPPGIIQATIATRPGDCDEARCGWSDIRADTVSGQGVRASGRENQGVGFADVTCPARNVTVNLSPFKGVLPFSACNGTFNE